jgi:regulator of replication initiation timing
MALLTHSTKMSSKKELLRENRQLKIEVAALDELLSDALDKAASQEIAHQSDIALIGRLQDEVKSLNKLLAKED